MKMKIFKPIKDFCTRVQKRAEQNRSSKEMLHTLEELAVVHETLNKFRSAGLLYVDFKHNNVTISISLAEQFLFDDVYWQRFLNQVYGWAVFQYGVSEYSRMFRECKANAEALAYKANPNLTESEKTLAKMQAVAKFDAEHGGKHMTVPDLQFYVIGLDNDPVIVARLINGRFETASVPGSK